MPEPSAAKPRCTVCGGEGNHYFADHEQVYADSAASPSWDDLRDPPIASWNDAFQNDPSHLRSLDGASTEMFAVADVAEVLYHGNEGADDWDGTEAAVIRLTDGRLAAWETWWGPTGCGFSEDGYGGDADVWFAKSEHLRELIAHALTDHGREMCGIPREGLSDA